MDLGGELLNARRIGRVSKRAALIRYRSANLAVDMVRSQLLPCWMGRWRTSSPTPTQSWHLHPADDRWG